MHDSQARRRQAVTASSPFTCVLDCRATLGECPVWSPQQQTLYFIDIKAPALCRFDPATGALRQMPMPEQIGSFALMRSGGFLAALRTGLWRLDAEGRVMEKLAANPEVHATSRFNDGRCDPHGRFFVGTIDETRTGTAGLYRFEAGRLTKLAEGLMTSNGLAFSPQGDVMYHADTPRLSVFRHAFDAATGTPGKAEVLATFASRGPDRGWPDGAAVDAEGCYWCALWQGGRIRRYAPDGELLAEYPVPARSPTMPAFGGPDLRTLYVTSARVGLTAAELESSPLSGGLFAMRVETPGLPEPEYAG
ncbi:Sugar lactone lactonase YvrE [Rhizobiales bacterium GAS191]|nr:Sugar lactone lactonase YvrE [Rhizobiales bacterium GAS113]SEB98873.1 Sugar lactone lactonase YvrE [Rhizobiales bacterium GAS188]SED24186.1 Sugar lactone lactonase YvrE [Rhizobiales bacterium GAS191]